MDAAHRADMVISQTGNVGLGTVTPTQKLDIIGGTRFRSLTLNNSLSRLLVSDPNGVLSYRDISSLPSDNDWLGAGTGNMYTGFSTDKVGIGTSTPSEKLDVQGAVEIGSGNMKINATAGDNFNISTKTNSPNPNFAIQIGNGSGGASNQPIFWNNMLILNGAGNSWCPTCGVGVDAAHRADMVISQTGNIGLGTVAPSAKLEVNGSTKLLLNQNNALTKIVVADTNGLLAYKDASTLTVNDNDWAINANGNLIPGSAATGGKVIIGNVTVPTGYKLAVEQGIITEKIKVAVYGTVNWADFVFDEDYKLQELNALEKYIKSNKHLPDVPSAEEVVANGIDLGKMDATLLQKVEELTLYVLQLNKKIDTISLENQTLINKNIALQNQVPKK